MERGITRILGAAVAVLLCAVALAAQTPGRKRMMGMYDANTETTIKGTVDAVSDTARGQMMGTHLTVTADGAATEVMLGPAKYVSDQGFAFAKGDSVEVTGSKRTVSGKEFVIAREVVKDGRTLTLRDKTGRPKWAGQMGPRRKTQ